MGHQIHFISMSAGAACMTSCHPVHADTPLLAGMLAAFLVPPVADTTCYMLQLPCFSAVYAFANVSGAHLNPAVSFALMCTGHMKWWKGLLYMIMQVGHMPHHERCTWPDTCTVTLPCLQPLQGNGRTMLSQSTSRQQQQQCTLLCVWCGACRHQM
jgi:hypothetical protein